MSNYFNFIPIELNVSVAYYLTSQELIYFCENNMCGSNTFWINLFNLKFERIPDIISRNIDYRKLYVDILKYEEFIQREVSEKMNEKMALLSIINDRKAQQEYRKA